MPMVAMAAFGTFPTATFTLMAIAYQLLGLDILGPIGVGILILSLVITVAAMAVVWRHPEGIAHSERAE